MHVPAPPRLHPGRLPLARVALDRDARARPEGLEPRLAEPGTRALVIHDGRALLAADGGLDLRTVADVPQWRVAAYLGRALESVPPLAAGDAVVLLVLDADGAGALEPDAARWVGLREGVTSLGERDLAVFAEGLGLANWHASYEFSPRTGHPTEPIMAGWVRRDSETGAEFFPRTDPAVIMAVTDADDRVLLGSNALWDRNRFSLLAGFVEPGESLEAAVAREVEEESGLRIGDPVYVGSQPWPFPASIMLGFRAPLAEGEPPDPHPDGEEIRELRWFTRDELASSTAAGEVLLPRPGSIARAILEQWFGGEIEDGSRR